MENTNKTNYPIATWKVVKETTKWGKEIVVIQLYYDGKPTDKYNIMEKWLYNEYKEE